LTTKIWRVIATLLIIFSLVLNLFLLLVLAKARIDLRNTITAVRNTLEGISQEPIEIPVEISQDIPINTTIPISQTIRVPIDIDYPLSTVINTSFNIPVLGRQELSLPIDTVIPVNLVYEAPIQEMVYISMVLPLHLELPILIEIPPEVRLQLEERLLEIDASLK
jgi:hypothetical protein